MLYNLLKITIILCKEVKILKFKNFFLLLLMLIIIPLTIIIINISLQAKEDLKIKQLSYKVTSVSEGEKRNIGELKIQYGIDGNYITITENKLYSGNFFSDDFTDLVENTKVYTFNKNYKLIKIEEKETLNQKDNITYGCEITDKFDYIEVLTMLNDEKALPVVFPKNEVGISSYTSGQYFLAKKNSIPIGKYTFFYNVYGYIDKYIALKNEMLKTQLFGDIECVLIEHKGASKSLIWINIDKGIIVKKEESLSDNYVLEIELSSAEYY